MKFNRSLYGNIMTATAIMAGSGVVCLTLVVCYELIARPLGHPTIWVTEFSEYLMVFCAFLGMGYTQWQKGHINVDVVVTRLPARIREILEMATLALTVIVGGILTWKSLELALHYLNYRSSSDWGPPLFPVYIWIPIGYFLVLVPALARIIRK